MSKQSEPTPQQESCLRCGIGKDDKPYGNCTGWGFFYNRHLWGETDPTAQQELGWSLDYPLECPVCVAKTGEKCFIQVDPRENGGKSGVQNGQVHNERRKLFHEVWELISTERTNLLNEVKGIVGKDEFVGLPVTQAQEQSNYNKKIRNKFRHDLLSAITTLEGER